MAVDPFPPSLQRLIRELSKLPSIGRKSAARLAYHLVQNDPQTIEPLAEAMLSAKRTLRLCSVCQFMCETERCSICNSKGRDESLLCVVEKPVDVVSIERGGDYRGLYHVLHGLWAPLKGMGPESMKLKELEKRLEPGTVKEVILATSATVEGDATAMYVAKLVGEKGVSSSRLAQGLPKGGELEYADEVTLSHAFAGRKGMDL